MCLLRLQSAVKAHWSFSCYIDAGAKCRHG